MKTAKSPVDPDSTSAMPVAAAPSPGGAGGAHGDSRPASVPDLEAGPAPIGVYVHFPWCLKKCPYCDFLSVASERPALPHAAYADAVLAELARRAAELGPRRLASVFFGGGTPSLWEPEQLGRALAGIRQAFDGNDFDIEVTVECNPTSLDEDRARALVDAGVNRVSIGVQGLDAQRLEFLGRLHGPADGIRAVEDAVRAGVPRVSADLIFGVAGQSAEAARTEARRLAELGVTHLSAYALTIEPGTQFGALARKGRLPLLAEDTVAESFSAVSEALRETGFEHYEISNYARGGDYAQHNLGYWVGREYLGLGCGAWGTVRSADAGPRYVRYRNTPSPERYLSSTGAWPTATLREAGPGELVSALEPLDAETLLRERILLGLRLAGGVDIDAHARALGTDAWPRDRERAARRLIERGRLAHDGSRWFIPEREWLLADGTISALL